MPGTNIRIAVSACLLGQPVRYDGAAKPSPDPRLQHWKALGLVVPVCPEVAGGLPVPRVAAELLGGDGEDVLDGKARVVTAAGDDVTEAFLRGAHVTLDAVRSAGATAAILKARSPSCSVGSIHDGSHTGRLRAGVGVAAALLRRRGSVVFDDEHLDDAELWLGRVGGLPTP